MSDGGRRTILQTPRLRVTTWVADDLADLVALHSDPEVVRYLMDGNPEPADKTAERLQMYLRTQEDPGYCKWRVEELDGTFVGRAGLGPGPEEQTSREVGYTLARSAWGKGYASELAEAIVRWHREHPTPQRLGLIGFAHVDNAASRRVLEKCGLVQYDTRDHAGRPHAFYRLPAGE